MAYKEGGSELYAVRFTTIPLDCQADYRIRFQVVVLSAYKQMRAQSVDVLSDVDEDNFDRAFTYLRPGKWPLRVKFYQLIRRYFLVIQGASDMGSRLSESELQRSLDFCINLFNPTSPEEHKAVEGQLAGSGKYRELMDVAKPLVDPKSFEDILKVTPTECPAGSTGCKETEANTYSESKPRMVLDKINARRLVHHEYAINNLEAEELLGCAIRLEKGRLGLMKVALVR